MRRPPYGVPHRECHTRFRRAAFECFAVGQTPHQRIGVAVLQIAPLLPPFDNAFRCAVTQLGELRDGEPQRIAQLTNAARRQQRVSRANAFNREFLSRFALIDGATVIRALVAAKKLPVHLCSHTTESHGDGFRFQRVSAAASTMQAAFKRRDAQ